MKGILLKTLLNLRYSGLVILWNSCKHGTNGTYLWSREEGSTISYFFPITPNWSVTFEGKCHFNMAPSIRRFLESIHHGVTNGYSNPSNNCVAIHINQNPWVFHPKCSINSDLRRYFDVNKQRAPANMAAASGKWRKSMTSQSDERPASIKRP